jgi:hypothetical protein
MDSCGVRRTSSRSLMLQQQRRITQSAMELDSRGSWDTCPGAGARYRACPGIRSRHTWSSDRLELQQP